jgi:DNA mismatch repair ATPase MutS
MEVVGPDVYNDLEFFHSYRHTTDDTIFELISKEAPTDGSRDQIRARLANPLVDADVLRAYQQRLSELLEHDANGLIDEHMGVVRRTKDDVAWVKAQHASTRQGELDGTSAVYFNFILFRALAMNDSATMLNVLNFYQIVVSPTIGVLSPLIYFLIPYVVLVRRFKMRFSFREFISVLWRSLVLLIQQGRTVAGIQAVSMGLSLFMYAQGVLGTTTSAIQAWRVCQHLRARMDAVCTYAKAGMALMRVCEGEAQAIKAEHTLMNLKSMLQERCSSLFVGDRLVVYHKLKSSMEEFDRFDTLMNATLADVTIARATRTLCRAQYVSEGDRAIVGMRGLRHPTLPNAVLNDFRVDGSNCLITGPNAAGKSTLVKAVAANVLLAQTIGHAYASECRLTPFSWINTQINIPDCKGVESLFQAEMHRCRFGLERARALSSDRYALLIFDEMFNSTNVVEGVAGAYAILSALAQLPNCGVIITTHYPYLARLSGYRCMRMEAQQDECGNVVRFPYKLTKGVSKQYIALEMLRKEFDPQIVDHAIEIKEAILKRV